MATTHEKLLRFMSPNDRVSGEYRVLETLPRIKCRDGFSMSCQAGYGLYCSPRDNIGDWSKIEVGFPSEEEALLMEYAEEPNKPTETVYGYTPVSVVAQVIDKHGGSEQLDSI